MQPTTHNTRHDTMIRAGTAIRWLTAAAWFAGAQASTARAPSRPSEASQLAAPPARRPPDAIRIK